MDSHQFGRPCCPVIDFGCLVQKAVIVFLSWQVESQQNFQPVDVAFGRSVAIVERIAGYSTQVYDLYPHPYDDKILHERVSFGEDAPPPIRRSGIMLSRPGNLMALESTSSAAADLIPGCHSGFNHVLQSRIVRRRGRQLRKDGLVADQSGVMCSRLCQRP
jgi:hypothetical protein